MRVDRIDWKAARTAFSARVVVRSFVVAVVVGTVLNAINQGPEILRGHSIDLLKLLLTYSVPFLVASYGAYAALARIDELGGDREN